MNTNLPAANDAGPSPEEILRVPAELMPAVRYTLGRLRLSYREVGQDKDAPVTLLAVESPLARSAVDGLFNRIRAYGLDTRLAS